MKFNPAAFDAFLGGIGQSVQWRRSYACACVNAESGQPDHRHKLCAGKGRIWDLPIETVTGVASQSVTAEWAKLGQFESGDMVLSIPQNSPLWNAGQFDRITMLNSTDVFSLPLKRGAPEERMMFKVSSLDRCFWLHPTTREIVDGALPVVDADGNPAWPGAGAPPLGTSYSLTGTKYDEYYVWGKYPSDRNQHQGMRLPKKLIARKFDLLNRRNDVF